MLKITGLLAVLLFYLYYTGRCMLFCIETEDHKKAMYGLDV